MKEIQLVTVDGREYAIGCLMTGPSLKLMTRLAKLLLPAGAAGLAGSDMSSIKALTETVSLPSAMAMVAEKMDEDQVLDMVRTLVKEVRRADGAPMPFDSYFMGETAHLFKVVAASLEVNYGDFFGVLKEWVGAFIGTLSPQPSPTQPSSQQDPMSQGQ